MKIKLLAIGKTDNKLLEQLMDVYQKRLKHYVKFELEVIPDIKQKSLSHEEQKTKEGQLILKKLKAEDYLMLLDEKGESYRSVEFAKLLQKRMNSGIKQLVLVIGGPYGFSNEVYQKAKSQISLSKMTFSHQMIRLFIIEQIYRSFTILKNEPYHHE